jgi:hypothetical protein
MLKAYWAGIGKTPPAGALTALRACASGDRRGDCARAGRACSLMDLGPVGKNYGPRVKSRFIAAARFELVAARTDLVKWVWCLSGNSVVVDWLVGWVVCANLVLLCVRDPLSVVSLVSSAGLWGADIMSDFCVRDVARARTLVLYHAWNTTSCEHSMSGHNRMTLAQRVAVDRLWLCIIACQ